MFLGLQLTVSVRKNWQDADIDQETPQAFSAHNLKGVQVELLEELLLRDEEHSVRDEGDGDQQVGDQSLGLKCG